MKNAKKKKTPKVTKQTQEKLKVVKKSDNPPTYIWVRDEDCKPNSNLTIEMPETRPVETNSWVDTSLDEIKAPRDWGDIPAYVLRQFTDNVPGRSLESELELGHVFRLTYITKTYIATVQVNIGDWRNEMGESIRVESTTWKDQAKYKVSGTATGGEIAKHVNLKALYDMIMGDLEKFGG